MSISIPFYSSIKAKITGLRNLTCLYCSLISCSIISILYISIISKLYIDIPFQYLYKGYISSFINCFACYYIFLISYKLCKKIKISPIVTFCITKLEQDINYKI